MRILIAEDDVKLASLVGETLKASGFVVDTEADGEVVLYRARTRISMRCCSIWVCRRSMG